MKQLAPMISSISLRSPQKTSGLFDIGFAGGNFDVTSLNQNAPAFMKEDPYPLDDLKADSYTLESIDGGSVNIETKLDNIHQHMMDSFDILDPLGDLEADQLLDDSLDAFVDLDQFLMGSTLFDETAELKPFSDIPTVESMTPTVLDTDNFLQEAPAKSRKRKAEAESRNVKPVRTRFFEILESENDVITTTDPEIDHDYTAKRQRLTATSDIPKHGTNGSNDGKGKAASKMIILHCEPSTSMDEIVSCTEETVTDKQAVRRMKNNVASKKSREQRKQKFADLDQEAERLIVANEELRRKIVELERTAREMKAQLVAKMTGK